MDLFVLSNDRHGVFSLVNGGWGFFLDFFSKQYLILLAGIQKPGNPWIGVFVYNSWWSYDWVVQELDKNGRIPVNCDIAVQHSKYGILLIY